MSAIVLLAWPTQAQLPIDPAMVDQLTPEQRQKALEALGEASSNDASARAQGQSATDANLGFANRAARGGTAAQQSREERTATRHTERAVKSADDQRVAEEEANTPGEAARTLKPFGYELFASAPSTFAPATDIPVPSDYVIGPGDNVRVQLFGNENANYSLQVSREGKINFPKLGPITVVGQRFDDLRTTLEDRVTREMIGVQASVTLGELRSIRVFLLGDVNQPGSYTVSSLSTITNALFVGGGIDKVGTMRRVQLKREGKLVNTFDLYDLLLRGDSKADIRLQPGDVIFVPPAGARVAVDGEVKRPAIYELNGESTVNQMIQLAGGMLASANAGTAQIERFDGRKYKTLRQLDIARAVDLAYRIQDGDRIRVRQIEQTIENNVRVAGFVKYPGFYEWRSGLTLTEVLQKAEIKPSNASSESYLAIGLIERNDPASGVRDFASFNVEAATNGMAAPITLQRDDLVVILDRRDISYLDSAEVRAVVAGNGGERYKCAGLQALGTIANSERAVRFLKTFQSENKRSDDAGRAAQNEDVCPEVFQTAPRALPYLLERSVAVFGEVRRPGIYPIAADTPLRLLIDAAGGLSAESDRANVEYISYREALTNGRSRYQTLNLATAEGAGKLVNAGDVLNFKPLYLGQEIGTVRIVGEFRLPGAYGILRGERLSQVVARAGGITPNAYPYGAVFTRASAREAEKQSNQRAASDLQEALVTAVTSGSLVKDNSTASSQLLGTVVQRLQSAQPVGRVVIEADPTILQARPEQDPLLEPGDALFMPKRPISVTVTGQVLNPGSLAFESGASFKQYIEKAGGYTQGADEGRAFIILPNGTAQGTKSSFWNFKSQDIPPGSLIVVPRDAAPFNIYAFSERFFGILANLAISAAALVTISNANNNNTR